MDLDLPINPASCAMLVEFGAERGVRASDCLRGTGLHIELLHEPGTEVTPREEFQVIRNLLHHLGTEPGLGLEAGLRYHVTMHGVAALALATSRDLREALQLAVRYADLGAASMPVAFYEKDGLAYLEADDQAVPEDIRIFLIERNAAALKVGTRDLLGFDLPPVGVQFRHTRPSDTGQYVEILGVEAQFGAEKNAIQIDSRLLNLPMPQANEIVRRGYEQACSQLLAERRSRVGVSGAVRAALVRTPGRMLDISEVAAELHTSARTLRRRLDEESTTFRKLSDEVRQVIAVELLVQGEMTTEQVAQRLGYAESASFIRAFKRWTGTSPQAYRLA